MGSHHGALGLRNQPELLAHQVLSGETSGSSVCFLPLLLPAVYIFVHGSIFLTFLLQGISVYKRLWASAALLPAMVFLTAIYRQGRRTAAVPAASAVFFFLILGYVPKDAFAVVLLLPPLCAVAMIHAAAHVPPPYLALSTPLLLA